MLALCETETLQDGDKGKKVNFSPKLSAKAKRKVSRTQAKGSCSLGSWRSFQIKITLIAGIGAYVHSSPVSVDVLRQVFI